MHGHCFDQFVTERPIKGRLYIIYVGMKIKSIGTEIHTDISRT